METELTYSSGDIFAQQSIDDGIESIHALASRTPYPLRVSCVISGESDEARDDFTSSIQPVPDSFVRFNSGCSSRINARARATNTVASEVPLDEYH